MKLIHVLLIGGALWLAVQGLGVVGKSKLRHQARNEAWQKYAPQSKYRDTSEHHFYTVEEWKTVLANKKWTVKDTGAWSQKVLDQHGQFVGFVSEAADNKRHLEIPSK